MAVRKDLLYPGRWNPSDADFPLGGPKNRTAPGAQDGSYFDNAWIKDYEAFFGRLMTEVGVIANETSDTAINSQFYTAFELSRPLENRLKYTQNWNVQGANDSPLPDATPRNYLAGSEIVDGVLVTVDATNVTFINGVLNGSSGVIRCIYNQDGSTKITKSNQYGGIKLDDGTQIRANIDDISTNGVRITESSGAVVVDVDLSVFPSGFNFFGLSDFPGVWPYLNNFESSKSSPVLLAENQSGWSNGSIVTLPDFSEYNKLSFFCGNEERYTNIHYTEDLLSNIGVTFNVGTYAGGSGEAGLNRITVQSSTQITVTSIGVNGAAAPLLFKVRGIY